ncbi:MAG: translation initiation factor IF-2 [Patescibacteria group bacterium]
MEETNIKTNSSAKRPPIVVVLGHVDHGKTKILDYIRKTKIAEKEAGGITQHIGAYQVQHNGKMITFLDTPGHEAFSAIRSRGAKVADIAILVVAADDGVKPQTKEAIKHIQDAKIPFIVALNKIDKEEARPVMAKNQLAEAGVLLEDYGGQISAVEISAKTGKNVDELLELILLTAELENLEANPNQKAKGVIIESHLNPKRGYLATLLIQKGTLKIGDHIVSGGTLAKVKMMEDFAGKVLREGRPSQPVLTLGWNESPDVGENFQAAETKEETETLLNRPLKPEVPIFLKKTGPQKENKKILNIVFKADTQSSLEAISEAIKNISSEEVSYNVVGYGIGNIKDNDIQTAANGEGIIYGFYVEIENSAGRLAEKEKVKVKTFKIIYELVEELRKDLSELLEPEIKRTVLGKLKILKLFKKGTNYQIVGGKVSWGLARRGALIDVLRNNGKIVSGRLSQLQHNKVDVEEVKEGLECGIRFEGPVEIKEGDVLEIYEEEKIRKSI